MIKKIAAPLIAFLAMTRRFLVDLDPGLMRFRIALKALVVCLIVVGLGVLWLDKIGVVVAALCAVVALMSVQGKTRPQQQITMLLAMVAFVVMLGLGILLHGKLWWYNSCLVVVCFVAFYLRRFGDRFLVFPTFSVVLFLLTSAFVIMHPIKLLIYVVVAVLISFISYFYCFPNKTAGQARHHYFILFYYFWKVAHRLNYCVTQDWSSVALKKLLRTFAHIEHILKKQALLISVGTTRSDDEQRIINLYALFRVLELVWDNLEKLTQMDQAIFVQLKPVMMPVLQSLEQLLSELDRVYNGHQQAIQGREALLLAYHAAAARVYDPEQLMGAGLVYYSNVLFGAKRIAELTQILEAQL